VRFPQKATAKLTRRHGSLNGVIALAVGLLAGGIIYCVAQVGSDDLTEPPSADETAMEIHSSHLSGLNGVEPAASNVNNNANFNATKLYSATIRKPAGPPQVLTGLTDVHGNAVTVSCSTCHATRKPDLENNTAVEMNEFHGSLKIAHGKISCLSCHNANDYDSLKLADGSRIEFSDVMSLCGQCHGPQMRDYEHNVHGGMNGYWDLTKGARQKNNCVDCHNPHSPQFPKMQPTFKPRDRFLDPQPNE